MSERTVWLISHWLNPHINLDVHVLMDLSNPVGREEKSDCAGWLESFWCFQFCWNNFWINSVLVLLCWADAVPGCYVSNENGFNSTSVETGHDCCEHTSFLHFFIPSDLYLWVIEHLFTAVEDIPDFHQLNSMISSRG